MDMNLNIDEKNYTYWTYITKLICYKNIKKYKMVIGKFTSHY